MYSRAGIHTMQAGPGPGSKLDSVRWHLPKWIGTGGSLPSLKHRNGGDGFRCHSPPLCSEPGRDTIFMSPWKKWPLGSPLSLFTLNNETSSDWLLFSTTQFPWGHGAWGVVPVLPVSCKRSQHLLPTLLSLRVFIPPGGDRGHFNKN